MAPDTSYTVPLLINGEEVTTQTTFDVISPSSHKPIWRCSSASLDHVQTAVSAAQAAFPAWSNTKPAERRNILLKAADIFESRADEYGSYMREETGAAPPFTNINLSNTAEMFRDVAGRISTIMGSIPACREPGTSALVLKEPLGVILGIAPW